jgi:hypothetical protein
MGFSAEITHLEVDWTAPKSWWSFPTADRADIPVQKLGLGGSGGLGPLEGQVRGHNQLCLQASLFTYF